MEIRGTTMPRLDPNSPFLEMWTEEERDMLVFKKEGKRIKNVTTGHIQVCFKGEWVDINDWEG